MSDYGNAFSHWDQPQRRTPMPTEGDNYGYASSMPHQMTNAQALAAAGPAFLGAAGAAGLAGRGIYNMLASPFTRITHPKWLGGADRFGTGLTQVGAAPMALAAGGIGHSLVPQSDTAAHQLMGRDAEDLNAMRYYGHDNMRGPR